MTDTQQTDETFSFRTAFEADTDLHEYGDNALSVFALTLYLRLDDPHEFAATAITEGPNDKKVDICHIDEVEGRVIIAQSYRAGTWGRQSAPANKASDLAIAVAWLLSASEDLIPAHLGVKAREIRRAIQAHTVSRLELLLIHNCLESINVKTELKAAADAARDIAASLA